MSAPHGGAANIFRDFDTGTSGPLHKPAKSDLRDWGGAIEADVFPLNTFADLSAATGLQVGWRVTVAAGTLGTAETGLIVAAGTYASPDGVLVRNLTNGGTAVQWVSLRITYASEAELLADPRLLAAGTYLRIASLDISHGADARTFVVAPAGVTDYDLVTAGGTLLYAQFGFPVASGVRAPMTHVVVIGDSIVEGSGGTNYGYGPVYSWTTEWIKKTRATLGDSGGYTAFDLTKANRVGASYGAGGTGSGATYTALINVTTTDPQRQRSLDFNGVTFPTWDTTSFITWNPNRNWDTLRIFFLRQAGGGKFEADHYSAAGAYRIQIDTSKQAASIGGGDSATAMTAGTYQLDYIDLTKAVGGSVNIRIRGTGAGVMCLYGVRLIEANGQCAYTMVCKGGYRARDYATLLDDATQKLWYQYLAPSHTMYCLGTNDRTDTDATTFMTYLSTTIGRVLTGSTAAGTASEIVLVAPNKTSAEGNMPGYRTAMAALARSSGWGYANNADYLGEFRDANLRGLILADGLSTHPSDLGRTLIAHNLCKYFGLPSAQYAFPAAYDSGSGGTTIELAQTLSNIRTGSVITAGTPQLLYNLGLVGGNANVMIDVTVTGQRTGTGYTVTQTQTYRLSNGTTTNQVTQFAAVGAVSGPGAEASAGGLTWDASIVGGLLQISVTPTGYDQRIMASARVYNANNTVIGNPAIEN